MYFKKELTRRATLCTTHTYTHKLQIRVLYVIIVLAGAHKCCEAASQCLWAPGIRIFQYLYETFVTNSYCDMLHSVLQ